MHTCLKGRREEDGGRLFSEVSSARTRGNGHQLKRRRFHLQIPNHSLHCEGERAAAAADLGGCGGLHPCTFAKVFWRWSRAAGSGRRCWRRQQDKMPCKGSCHNNQAVISEIFFCLGQRADQHGVCWCVVAVRR